MSVYRLKPKNDFLFKRLFGESDSKHLLIPLLNAILGAPSRRSISDVTVIDNKELTKQVMDGKSGRLDVRCETDYHEQIDIEVQIAPGACNGQTISVLHQQNLYRLHQRRKRLHTIKENNCD